MPNVFITQHYHLTLHCIDDHDDKDDNDDKDDEDWNNNCSYRERVEYSGWVLYVTAQSDKLTHAIASF